MNDQQFPDAQDRNNLYNRYNNSGFSESNPHAQPYPQYMPPPAQHAKTKRLPTWAVVAIIVGGLVFLIGLFSTPSDPAQKAGNAGLPNVVTTPTPTPKPSAIAPRTKEVVPATPVNPDRVRAGQSFVVNDKQVLSGWKVSPRGRYFTVSGKVKNVGEFPTIMTLVEFKFIRGAEIVGDVQCSAGDIEPGRVATLDCFSGDLFTRNYDRIEVDG